MRQLTQFIHEKLHVSQFKSKAKKCSEHFGISQEAGEYMAKNFLEFSFNNPDIDKFSICSDFEGAFMLAAMLADDGNNPDDIRKLGYKSYRAIGKHNPYDFSWYEEEDEDTGTDYLGLIQEMYGVDDDSTGDPKFRKIFKDMFDFCKKNKINPDDVWGCYEDLDL